MTVYADIVTGFLESGKTTFIKEHMESEEFSAYKKVLLIVCEEGVEEYDKETLEAQNIQLMILEDIEEITEERFEKAVRECQPEYILIEYNGTWNISRILGLKLPGRIKFRNVMFMSEALTFKSYLSNMAFIMQPQILNSDFVLFNRCEKVKDKRWLRQSIKNINGDTTVIFSDASGVDKEISKYFIPFKKYEKIGIGMRILILILIGLSIMPASLLQNSYNYVQSVAAVFLGILMEAVPFILLGSFLSAMIQILVSTNWILRKFSQDTFVSFFIAVAAGFFMPVCDCGLVPIVSGLLRKQTPLPQVITFWLASSAVNPVVLISVYYAFPEQKSLILIRLIGGVVIGIIVGAVLKIAKFETKDVIKENGRIQYIGSDMLEVSNKNKLSKVEAVFQAAKSEFFRVGKYVIAGALISSALQTLMPQTIKSLVGSNITIQFLIMVIAAVFMSTCSTSNAFIGRSFYSNFSIMPIMSFIVMGPMLDFKNMIMLSEVLKKQFLIKLTGLIIVTGLVVFSILTVCF